VTLEQNTIFYAFSKGFCRVLLTLYNRLHIKNVPALPEGRPVIVASNHNSNLDPVVVGVAYPRKLKYLAKEELFKVPILSYIIRHLGAIPVSRQDEHKAGVILRTLLEILSRGEDILIFPEGSRSFDGKLQPMEGGVAMLASHAKAPILPVCVKGTFEAMPRGSSVPKPKKIEVIFGRLIDPLDLPDDMKEKEKRLYVLDQLEQQMKEMMLKLG
jgi:1-acyl-sn-glycerol-3-phosphate acyltransferase